VRGQTGLAWAVLILAGGGILVGFTAWMWREAGWGMVGFVYGFTLAALALALALTWAITTIIGAA